jgi:hypothetical protein
MPRRTAIGEALGEWVAPRHSANVSDSGHVAHARHCAKLGARERLNCF